MSSPTPAIQKYINEVIRLSQSDISSAKTSREWFLDRISSEISKRLYEPILYKDEPFLYFSSYFKRTKVNTVDEFDILVVIDSNSGIFTSRGIQIGTGVGYANPNHKYDSTYMKEDGSGISPTKLLNWLKDIVTKVTDAYGGEAPIRNGQAITATIKSRDLKIDLVPAGKFYNSQTDKYFYNIPRGDLAGGWILTNPTQDIDLLNTIANGKTNFRNIIRIIKRIRDTHNLLVSSFALETAAIQYCQVTKWYDNLFIDLEGALKYISNCFILGSIPDSYDTNNNLISDVTSLLLYADRLTSIIAILDDCYENETDTNVIYNRIYNVFENI